MPHTQRPHDNLGHQLVVARLGYLPGVAQYRLAHDVAQLAFRVRPTRVRPPAWLRLRPVHWHELPMFVRDRAAAKGIDLGDAGQGHTHRRPGTA